MQDIHVLGGGGDRRLRPHNQSHQTLKCPRCDSINTKFCYYNNYNLSQPRHFCKSCRRYWTKGGVLRNVPVGGGCRKAKRSKAKHSSAARTQPQDDDDDDGSKANSRSSSESSSTLTVAGGSGEAASLLKVRESSGLVDEQGQGQGSVLAEVGNLTSLINSKETTPYGFSPMVNQEQWAGGSVMMMMDPTVEGEVRSALDWRDHQSLFDLHLPNTLDQTYWNQTQWSDPGLYLP